jgi:hypothetical protein
MRLVIVAKSHDVFILRSVATGRMQLPGSFERTLVGDMVVRG